MDIESAAANLQRSLNAYRGFDHLRVKKRGQSLTIFSGKPDDPWLHARLSRKTKSSNLWALSLPNHRGRWERTPYVGNIQELTEMLVRDFPFHFQDFLSQRIE